MPAELVTGTASELNDLLAAGELQVSVVSAVEYARNAAAYHLLPDLAITCDGPVHSVALFSQAAGRGARRLHACSVTASSRTSVLLLELLCRHRWGCGPRFATARAEAPDLASLAGLPHEAVLVIGDAALHARAQERYPVRARSRRRVEGVDRTAVRLRGLGRPARGGRGGCRRCTGGCSSRGPGGSRTSTSSPPQAARAHGRHGEVCRAYLGDLDYALSYRHLAGLTDFFRRLAQDGLVPDGSLSFIAACVTERRGRIQRSMHQIKPAMRRQIRPHLK